MNKKMTQQEIDEALELIPTKEGTIIMILKGQKSLELEKFFSKQREEMNELEDRMHRMGHSDFKSRCPHQLVQEVPNPNGPMFNTICISCGMEVVKK